MALSPPRSRASSRRTPRSSGRATIFSPDRYQRPNLTDKDIEELRMAFDLVDSNDSGMIEPIDLRSALQSLGFEPKNSTVYHIFSYVDRDCSGCIDFDEFIEIVTDQIKYQDKK